MEQKIIKGNVNLKRVIIGYIIFIVSVVVLLLLINIPNYIADYNYYKEEVNEYNQNLLEWENGERYYKPNIPYCMEEADSAFTYCLFDGFSIIKNFVLRIFMIASIIVFPIFIWAVSKMQIVVTDKRVYGKTYFGRSVDLPVDSISAVGSTWFKGIAVSTPSGHISFLLIQNAKEIHATIRKLLIGRQEERAKAQAQPIPAPASISPVEELKQYKELLDSGVITQEDFDAKKKQLLGL